MRKAPAKADLPVPPAEVIAFLDGAQDLWLASCSGFYASPFGKKGQACPVPFWGCLDCGNAVITSRKLPSLIAFLEFMVAQRENSSCGRIGPPSSAMRIGVSRTRYCPRFQRPSLPRRVLSRQTKGVCCTYRRRQRRYEELACTSQHQLRTGSISICT